MTTSAEPILPTEQEEWDELAKIGIVLTGPTSDAQLDAAASEICRRLGEARAELDRFEEAEQAEVMRIEMRYAALCEPLEHRISQLEELGREVARRADFGKKKSRTVGFGSYGRKKKSERVKIIDPDAAIEFARAQKIEGAVASETIEKPVHKVLEPAVIAYVHKNEGVTLRRVRRAVDRKRMKRLPLVLGMPISPAVQETVEAYIKRATEQGYVVVTFGTSESLRVVAVKAEVVQPECAPLAGAGA